MRLMCSARDAEILGFVLREGLMRPPEVSKRANVNTSTVYSAMRRERHRLDKRMFDKLWFSAILGG